MLGDVSGVRNIYIVTGHTDMRKSIDGLVAIIRDVFMQDPFSNSLFLFCGRRNDRIRGLTFEGDGYLLMTKRLRGENRFQWPRNEDDMKKITMEQYRNLMEGFAVEGSIREV